MIVLVTGATGFVGACLVRRLIEEGHETHAFIREGSDVWRIKDVLDAVCVHKIDLRDVDAVEGVIRVVRPNAVFHLATYGGFATQTDQRAIVETNLFGTMNLLRACEKVGFELFVNTGSSSEYGFKDHPMRETDILAPVGDYGVSKAASTLFCRSEAQQKELPVITLRLFSPYGAWDDRHRLIPYVISNLLSETDIVLSSPYSVRDYVFIEDVLDMYLGTIRSKFEPGDIVNIGSGVQHSVEDVVSTLCGLAGTGATPHWGGRQISRPEPKLWVADTHKMDNSFGLQKKTKLYQGLKNTLKWFEQNRDLYLHE